MESNPLYALVRELRPELLQDPETVALIDEFGGMLSADDIAALNRMVKPAIAAYDTFQPNDSASIKGTAPAISTAMR